MNRVQTEMSNSGIAPEKKITALDLLDKVRGESPKDLRYMCMQRIVNGAMLYINDGRQWEAEMINAKKNLIKVEADLAFSVEEKEVR